MKKNNLLHLILITSLTVFLYSIFSCSHENMDPDLFPEICFESQILPIFQSSCAISGCHDNSGGEAGYDFRNYNGIVAGTVAGKPSSSPVYTSLSNIWGEGFMPPDQPLSENNRTLIRYWILQGARNTVCPDTIQDTSIIIIDDSVYINPRACFGRDVFPYIQSNCAISGCHDDITADEGYRFTSYSGVMKAIQPGNPQESKLYKSITRTDEEDIMPPPPMSPLPQSVIDSIYNWITYGALNENCGEACDTTSTVTFSGVIYPIIAKNCKGCHSGSSPSGNIGLENYAQISLVASNGSLVGALKGTNPFVAMPPGRSLSDCRIRQFELWVSEGYPDN